MKHHTPSSLLFAILATDVALFTFHDEELYVRLMDVDRPPHFPHVPGLLGALIHPQETAPETAARIVRVKGFINPASVYFEELATFSAIDRDPRGRVVAVAYSGYIPWEKLSSEEQEGSTEVSWVRVRDTHSLAYDHDQILKTAISRLQSRIAYTTLIQKIMPREFTLTDLENTYEAILRTEIDKRNFRKKVLKLDILKPLNKKRSTGAFRPAELYSFVSKEIKNITVL